MLLHLLVLAPFAAAILMMATSKEDPKSSSRLAFLFGFAFVALSRGCAVSGATRLFTSTKCRPLESLEMISISKCPTVQLR